MMNNWDSKLENTIMEIGQKSRGYKIMHLKESNKLISNYNFLMYSGIFLGPLAGLIAGIGATFDPESDPTFPVISACIAFISGVVVAMTKFGNFEEKSSDHKKYASKYSRLENNIIRQLVLEKKRRIEGIKYFKWINESFDDLFLGSPLLKERTYNNYIRGLQKKEDTKDDTKDSDSLITIEEDKPTKKNTKKSDFLQPWRCEDKLTCTNKKRESILFVKDKSRREKSRPPIPRITNTTCEGIALHTIKEEKEMKKYSDGRMKYEINRMNEK